MCLGNPKYKGTKSWYKSIVLGPILPEKFRFGPTAYEPINEVSGARILPF